MPLNRKKMRLTTEVVRQLTGGDLKTVFGMGAYPGSGHVDCPPPPGNNPDPDDQNTDPWDVVVQ